MIRRSFFAALSGMFAGAGLAIAGTLKDSYKSGVVRVPVHPDYRTTQEDIGHGRTLFSCVQIDETAQRAEGKWTVRYRASETHVAGLGEKAEMVNRGDSVIISGRWDREGKIIIDRVDASDGKYLGMYYIPSGFSHFVLPSVEITATATGALVTNSCNRPWLACGD